MQPYPEILAVAERWRRPIGRAAGANAEAVPKRATARRTAERVAIDAGVRAAPDILLYLENRITFFSVCKPTMAVEFFFFRAGF